MSQLPELSIVIVNYNTWDFTAQCINSICKNSTRYTFEIILIDNASTDDSVERLEKRYPEFTLIRNPCNTGIAGGNNLGIRAARGKYIFMVNNDTLVLPGTIDRAVDFLVEHPEAGGVGGNLLNSDRSFQSGHFDFPTLSKIVMITTKLGEVFRPYYPSNPRGSEIEEVDWMSTAFMVFRREALFDVGLVDEDYFIYSDESDLQYRIRLHGWKIYYLPDLETIHFGGKSLNPWRRRRLVYRGYLLFFSKHRTSIESFSLRILFIVACSIKIIFWSLISIFRTRRERVSNELNSNISILKMCLKREIETA